MNTRTKQLLINAGKISIAAGLVIWMIHSGKLDLTGLTIFIENPLIPASCILTWIIAQVCLGSLRWQMLLNGAGYSLSWARAVQLQLTGFFFASAMPGAVGGDLVKVLYVIRENKDKGKSPAMVSILLDRIIGMLGLFSIGLVAICFNLQLFWKTPDTQKLVFLIIGFTLFILLFFLIILMPKSESDPISKLLSWEKPGIRQLKRVYETLRFFRNYKATIFKCWLISVIIQFFCLLFFFSVAQVLTGNDIYFSKVASVFPLGILTTALPIAPGGLGVGHMAFEKLFEMVSLTNGANAFNAYFLGFLTLNISGMFSYLTLKKEGVITPESPGTGSGTEIAAPVQP